MNKIAGLLLALLVSTLVACDSGDKPSLSIQAEEVVEQIVEQVEQVEQAEQSEQAAASSTAMQTVTFPQWQQALKSIAAETEVVVVDFWAMWCVSCLEQFPEMVALSRAYQGKASFVSLNLDAASDKRALAKAQDFLTASGASFAHFHLAENMMEAFETFDLVGIPAVVFYDSAGQEIYRLTGDDPENQFTKAQIKTFIDQRLAAK